MASFYKTTMLKKEDFYNQTISVNSVLFHLKDCIDSGKEFTWHPYGFIVMKLMELPDGSSVRFHIWPKSSRKLQKPEWPPHSHPWKMTSFIIEGSLRQIVYSIETKEQNQKCSYQVEYDNKVSKLIKTSESLTLNILQEEKIQKGDYYSLNAGVFHELYVPKEEFTATCLLTEPISGIVPLVYGDKSGKDSYTYKRIPVDKNIVLKCMMQLGIV